MPKLDDIKNVVQKLASIEGVGEHLCFFGGSVPYMLHGIDSNREHSDIDVLVGESYMSAIREWAQDEQNGCHYNSGLDSLNLGLNDDYGFKVYIDGVYVEFEPSTAQNGVFVRKSFSPNRGLAGREEIPFENIEDIMTSVNIGGAQTFFQSVEMIKAGKEQYRREKDLQDIAFIESQGYDTERYARVKQALESKKEIIGSYAELQASTQDM